MIKAVFLDFYGTLVEEDDKYIDLICRRIAAKSKVCADSKEIGLYWWKVFTGLCNESYGRNYKTQRELELISLRRVIEEYKSTEDAMELSHILYNYWQCPVIFPESKAFLDEINLPIYIVSNIDRGDIELALEWHSISVEDVITSEDARSYKPRKEIFLLALERAEVDTSEVVHIGDSYSSDIQGAANIGIKPIWINRKSRKVSVDVKPITEYDSLSSALEYLRAGVID